MVEIWTIYKKIWISAGHHIASEGYTGNCARRHGHNYEVEVWITATKLNQHGMVIDFNDLKAIVNQLDHQYINELFANTTNALAITPTAECIAQWVAQTIKTQTGFSSRVKVWETPTGAVEYWSE